MFVRDMLSYTLLVILDMFLTFITVRKLTDMVGPTRTGDTYLFLYHADKSRICGLLTLYGLLLRTLGNFLPGILPGIIAWN